VYKRQPLNGFSPILNWIKKNNIPYSILSAPLRGNHKASIAGKKSWLSKHNPNAKEEIFTGTKEKYAMAGGQPNVLIDDHGKYITRWQSNGGIGIKHTDKNPQATISALEKIYSNQVEENISVTGTRRGQEARKKKLRPGSEEWFKHWFSLPLMKREDLELAKTEMLEYAKQYMQEGYRLQLERGTDMDVLHITDTTTGKRTEVRGKPDYERAYDPTDKLHQLLDKIGKASNISDLINGEVVGINPKHPDGTNAKKHADTAFNESSQLDSLSKFVRSQREAPDQVLYQMMMAPDTYGHEASNFVRSWYEKTKEENGLNDVDSALEIMVDELRLIEKNVDENFKDGKKPGRKGLAKRMGVDCSKPVGELRKIAKNSSGEKQRMAHWCANMKSGRK